MDELRYPTGRFQRPTEALSPAERRRHVERIASTPAALRKAVDGLSDSQLDTPYRPGGWTVRQVVHHVPDSHLNAYVRFKLALTEDVPTIKPYDEARWALLGDVSKTPIETSLSLLDALHERWVALLGTVAQQDYERQLVHPQNGTMTLDQLLALYSWHGPHHVAHVTRLRERNQW